MKDDLVKQISQLIQSRYNDTMMECAGTAHLILAIARPAILEEAAEWHEKNARYCREVSRDEPRINLDARQKARIAASHHDASAVGLRHLAHTTGQEGGR